MSDGRVCVKPNPGWNPSLVKFAANRASGHATLKSGTNDNPYPPRIAASSSAPTIGVFVANNRTASTYK